MPHSMHPRFLESITFQAKHLQMLSKLGEHRGRQSLYLAQQPQELEHLRQAAIVASTVSSNRIEGIEVSPKRLSALMKGTPKPKSRAEGEVAGYRKVLELIHESHEHMDMRPNMILQLHKLLYSYHPSDGGRYKSMDNTIIETNKDGETRVRFEPTSAIATPGAMETLCRRYQQARAEYEALIVMPLLIFDFLCIHPFGDGNGRISRLLTLLELYRAGHLVGRYVSVERVIEETKEGYYQALEASSKGWHDGEHDALPWLEYFWSMLIGVYAEFEDRVENIISAGQTKAEAVELVVLNMGTPFTLAELSDRLPHVSKPTISRTLGELRDKGLVRLDGRGRGAKWMVV